MVLIISIGTYDHALLESEVYEAFIEIKQDGKKEIGETNLKAPKTMNDMLARIKRSNCLVNLNKISTIGVIITSTYYSHLIIYNKTIHIFI